jgi:hypothetical protein
MVAITERKALAEKLHNVHAKQRDFVADGTGLEAASVNYAMLFNILHAENPVSLLREAWRVLSLTGVVAVIHWNYDPATPRGPSMTIRPRPEQCVAWGKEAGFTRHDGIIDVPPYHYGIVFHR